MKLSLLTLQRVQEKGKVEILLANETVFTDIAKGTGEGKGGNSASK